MQQQQTAVVTVDVDVIPAETKAVIVNYMDGTTPVGQTKLVLTVDKDGFVTVEPDNADLIADCPKGYEITQSFAQSVDKNSTERVDVTVAKLYTVALGQIKTSTGSVSNNFSLENLSDTSVVSGSTVTFDIVHNGNGSNASYKVTVGEQQFTFTKGTPETKQVTVTVTGDMTIDASVI